MDQVNSDTSVRTTDMERQREKRGKKLSRREERKREGMGERRGRE